MSQKRVGHAAPCTSMPPSLCRPIAMCSHRRKTGVTGPLPSELHRSVAAVYCVLHTMTSQLRQFSAPNPCCLCEVDGLLNPRLFELFDNVLVLTQARHFSLSVMPLRSDCTIGDQWLQDFKLLGLLCPLDEYKGRQSEMIQSQTA